MASRRIRIIALILAVLFTIVFYIIISRSTKVKGSSGLEETVVMIASEDIPPYTEITDEMISKKEIAVEEDMKNFFKDEKDVLGKVSNSQIFPGEILNPNRLVSQEDASLGLAARIEKGMRAITIAVDIEQGVSDTIRIGNYVDVIVIREIDSGDLSASNFFDQISGEGQPENTQSLHTDVGRYVATVALQNVKVISLDDVFYKNEGNVEVGYESVTLELTPEEATQLALLPEEGNIRLSLRSIEDDTIESYPRDTIIKDLEDTDN